MQVVNTSDFVNEMTMKAQQLLPSGSHMWLYGSRARGEAREDSDWDVLILLNKERVEQDDFEHLAYPFVEMGWSHDAVVSPQLYTQSEWEKLSFLPYYKNVVRDKIVML